MSPIPSFVTNAVERLLFKSVVVSEVRNIGPRFRLVHLEGKGFEGVKWVPGQTAQFHLGNLMARAYTPMDLDSKNGSARFLFYLHGGGPGSTWASSLKIGDGCLVMRPKDSLDFASFHGPAIFFGDETSFAAAQALHHNHNDGVNIHYVFEVSSPADVALVIEELGLDNTSVIQRNPNDSHIETVVKTLMEKAMLLDSPQWFLTGMALSIQQIRKRLRALAFSTPKLKVKAYWLPGKVGLD